MEEKNTKIKNNKKLIIIGMVIIIAGIIVFVFIKIINNPVNKFKNKLESSNVSVLKEIYYSTSSNDERKEMEKILKDKLENIVNDFIEETKSYEDTKKQLDGYDGVETFNSNIEEYKSNVEKIKTSKDNFAEAQVFKESNNILETAKKYLNVIELDKNNYTVAQNYINNSRTYLKDIIITELETAEREYDSDYISDGYKGDMADKAKKYIDTVYSEIGKINKDNYKIYFEIEKEYSKFIRDTYLEVGNRLTQIYMDIINLKKDVSNGAKTMEVFIVFLNNIFTEYIQDNAEILLGEYYTPSRAKKYDDMQAKVQKELKYWEEPQHSKKAILSFGELVELVGNDFEKVGVD